VVSLRRRLTVTESMAAAMLERRSRCCLRAGGSRPGIRDAQAQVTSGSWWIERWMFSFRRSATGGRRLRSEDDGGETTETADDEDRWTGRYFVLQTGADAAAEEMPG